MLITLMLITLTLIFMILKHTLQVYNKYVWLN